MEQYILHTLSHDYDPLHQHQLRLAHVSFGVSIIIFRLLLA